MLRHQGSGRGKTNKKWLLLLFLFPLLLRLAFVFYVEVVMLQGEDFKYGDELDYHRRSWGLAEGYKPKISTEKFGYYAVVTPFYYLFGPHKMSVILFQCVLGAVACVLVYLFVRDAFSPNGGVAAWALCSLYPPLIWWCGFLLKEAVMVFLLTAMIYTAFRGGRAVTVKGFLFWAVIASLCGFYLAIMRLTFFSFIPIILFWMVIASKRWRDALLRILCLLICGAVIFIALNLPYSPLAELDLERITPRRIVDRWVESFYSLSERFVVETYGWTELYRQWRIKPRAFVKRVGLVWRAFAERPPKDLVSVLTGAIYLFLLPFFAYGFVCALTRNPRDALALLALILMFTIIHMFTLPRLRFRIQVMVIVLIFASIGLNDTVSYLKSLKKARYDKREIGEA